MSRAQLTEAINRALAEDAQCTHETQWAGFCVHCGKHMTSLVPHPVARNGHRPVPEEEEGPCTHECQFAGLCADCGKEIEPNRYPTHDPIFSDNKSKDSISKREEEEGPCTHKITFAGLCADCGMNMKPDRPTARNASFSANKPAESISKKEENGAPCAHKTTFANLCADCGEAVPSPTLTANTPTPQTANRPPAYRSRDWTAAYNDCTNDDDDDGLPDFVPTPHQARTTSPPPSHHTEETSHSTAQAPCVHPTQFAGICLACNTDTRSPGPRSQPPYNTAPIPETIDLRASSRLAGITRDGPPPEGFDTTSLTRAEAREFAELRLGRVIEGLGYEALKESWKGKPNGELHAAMVGDIAKEVLRDVLVDELLGEEGVGRGLRERRGVADGRRGAVDFGRGGTAPVQRPNRAGDRNKENQRPDRNAPPETYAEMVARLRPKVDESRPPPRCPVCNVAGQLRACTGCNRRFYCSPACQRADWAQHKRACRDAQRKVEREAADAEAEAEVEELD